MKDMHYSDLHYSALYVSQIIFSWIGGSYLMPCTQHYLVAILDLSFCMEYPKELLSWPTILAKTDFKWLPFKNSKKSVILKLSSQKDPDHIWNTGSKLKSADLNLLEIKNLVHINDRLWFCYRRLNKQQINTWSLDFKSISKGLPIGTLPCKKCITL